jgi:hypothetical protein
MWHESASQQSSPSMRNDFFKIPNTQSLPSSYINNNNSLANDKNQSKRKLELSSKQIYSLKEIQLVKKRLLEKNVVCSNQHLFDSIISSLKLLYNNIYIY